MPKYKEYFQRMLEVNKQAFDDFRKIHQQYSLNQDQFQDTFNQAGQKILAIISDWENKLCRQSEKAGFGNYTTNLAEKFQAEVKKEFPLIDCIGLIAKPFSIRKISLES